MLWYISTCRLDVFLAKLTEPVNGVHGALKDAMAGSVQAQRLTKVPHSRQERIDDPVLEHHVSQNSTDNLKSFQAMDKHSRKHTVNHCDEISIFGDTEVCDSRRRT